MNLLELLKAKGGPSIAAAESLTAGRVQSLISGTDGISEFFRGGITAYTIDAKVELLAVNRDEAAKVNCVSEETAIAMARGVTQLFHSDLGVATTGYASPHPANTCGKPCAYWAIWDRRSLAVVRSGFYQTRLAETGRVEVQKEVAEYVYQQLCDALENLPSRIPCPVCAEEKAKHNQIFAELAKEGKEWSPYLRVGCSHPGCKDGWLESHPSKQDTAH